MIKKVNALKKKGFFHLFFSNFLIQFMAFGSQMLVAGLLLPEDLGRIKTLQTFVDVASIIGGGGLIVAILKLVPEHTDETVQRFVLRYSLKAAFMFSVIVFLFLNGLALFNLLSSDVEVNNLFHLFSIVILLSPVSLLLVRYFQALERFKEVSKIQVITKTISVILIIGLTYLFLARGYLLGVVIGFAISLMYLLFYLRAHLFNIKPITTNVKTVLVKQIINLSKFNFLGQLSDQFRVYTSFFVANYLIVDREIFGQYSFALILIQSMGILSSSVQQFLIPKFSKNSSDKTFFFIELKRFEKNYFLIAILIFCLAQLIIPIVTSFVFNGKYDASIPFFRVMLIGWLIYCGFTLKGPAFLGLGRLDISFRISATVLIIIIPISIVMCYYLGIWGVVYSYLIQRAINLILSTYYINRLREHKI